MATTGSECIFSGIVPLHSSSHTTAASGLGSTQWLSTRTLNPATGAYSVPQNRVLEVLVVPAGSGKKALEVNLTDPNDPFFIYHGAITEEDFYALKREQGLVVDFGAFPYKLIDLAQRCAAHAKEAQPAFSAVLSDGTLAFVETTALRNITHLQIKLAGASDAYLREHLHAIYRQQQTELETLRAALHVSSQATPQKGLPPTLYQAPSYPAAGNGNPFGQTQPIPTSTSNMNMSSTLSMNFVERCRQLEERIVLLDASNVALKQSTTQLEQRTRELDGQLQAATAELGTTKAELRKAQDLLTSRGLTAQISGLEQAVRDKDAALQRLNEMLQAAGDAKAQLEQSNASLRDALARSDRDVQTQRAEISKANDIIRRLQEESKSHRQALKTHQGMVSQQEKLLHDLRQQYDGTRHEVSQMRRTLDEREREIGARDSQLAELTRQARNQRVTIDGLQTVVARQNRVLQEHNLDFLTFERKQPASWPLPQPSAASAAQAAATPGLMRAASTEESGDGLTEILDRYGPAEERYPPKSSQPGAAESSMMSAELSDLLKRAVTLHSDTDQFMSSDNAAFSDNAGFTENPPAHQPFLSSEQAVSDEQLASDADPFAGEGARRPSGPRFPRIFDDFKRPEGGAEANPDTKSSSSNSPPSVTA